MEVWFILLIVFAFIVALVCILVGISRKAKFDEELEENIDKEIHQFLIEKHNPNYEFQNSEIEAELRNRLKAAMIDLRSNGYRYKPSYLYRTTTKDNEIYKIINRYYIMDRKASY